MNKYSPIKNIIIRNFRNLGEAKLSFEKSPIMCFIGENEAGKTSAVKAITVLGFNAWVRDQKDYVRDNTDEFDVGVQLEDGTMVARMKTRNRYNIYKIIYPDGTSWQTDKISEGLPVQVSDIMGLIEETETGEFLHTRTYEDQLLFVTTASSTNYKVMYNALKVKNLTNAIKLGSLESNALKQDINNNEFLLLNQSNVLRSIRVVDTEPLRDIKSNILRLKRILEILRKAMYIKYELKVNRDRLGVLKLVYDFDLAEIDIKRALNINSVSSLIKSIGDMREKLSCISDVNSMEYVDTSIVTKIKSVMDRKSEYEELTNKLSRLSDVQEMTEIDYSVLDRIDKVKQSVSDIESLREKLDRLDIGECQFIEQSSISSINKLSDVIAKIGNLATLRKSAEAINIAIAEHEDVLKRSGARIETCPNCGTDIVVV